MASGTIPGTAYRDSGSVNSGIDVKIEWSSVPNTEGNYSTVTATLYVRRNNDYTTYGSGTWYIKINGNQKTISRTVSFNLSTGWYEIGRHTVTVYHNPDGTKSCNVSATGGISGTSYASTSCSGTAVLNTIPRASQPTVSASSVTMGSSVTIYTNRADGSFTHTIKYVFAGTTFNLATGVSTSCTFTPPKSLANHIPNAQSGTATIYCYTYSGSTLIGTKTVSVTIRISSDIKPTVSAAISDPTGYFDVFNAYVVSKSKIRVDLTEAGSYGSTIASREISMNGTIYTTDPATSEELGSTAHNRVTFKVKDSRGVYSNEGAGTLSVMDYSPPQINAFSVSRCNADGTVNDEGEYAKVIYDSMVTPLNNINTKALTLRYKKRDDETYTEQTIALSAYAATGEVIVSADGLSSYDFSLVLTDYFSSVTKAMLLSTAFTLLDFSAGGRGIAFGKISESEDLMDFALPAKFRNGIFGKNGGEICPIGMSFEWNDNTIPIGYLEENGQAVSRTTYADLFAIIGTTYGSGDGSSTFNVPDSRKRDAVGFDSSDMDFNELGKTGGEKYHAVSINEMPSHTHIQNSHRHSLPHDQSGYGATIPANSSYLKWSTGVAWTSSNLTNKNATSFAYSGANVVAINQNTGGGVAHNNLQPYITKRKIIKY